jgi:hypothetical protein
LKANAVDGDHELAAACCLLFVVAKATEDFSEEGRAREFSVLFELSASLLDVVIGLAIADAPVFGHKLADLTA